MDMMVISTFRNRLFSLLREKSGNFGMMTALLLPVSVGVVGLGMDATLMLQNKRTLQNAVDAAALATATAMTDGLSKSDAEAMAKSFVASQMANTLSDATSEAAKLSTTPDISTETASSGSSETYDVALTGSYTMTMNALSQALGWKTVTITAYGKAEAASGGAGSGSGTQTLTPISMYLALDRSGSMNESTDTSYTTTCTDTHWTGRKYVTTTYSCTAYYTKIESLKLAVQRLATKLNEADPQNIYVRTGADSYNSSADAAQGMNWGTSKVVTYVNALQATGGTDATGALTAAYNALKASNTTEATAHKTSNFKRYVVFLTDGEMTGNSSNWNSSIDKKVRKQCDTIKQDGIEIYTIALSAPANGKSLLKACATDDNHYYEATDSISLISAFSSIGENTAPPSVRLTN
jgi:Flp pilus assembly protein TadG/uncharacterized protein YegL